MKTRLAFLALLIACFSCGKDNKSVTDSQKEKIKEEIKEVVNTMFKGCEEANPVMATEPWLDSPDFIYTANGNSFDYKEITDGIKSVFSTLINQKVTIAEEKYAFLDNSTVLYSNSCKWLQNYKDGHANIIEPDAMLIMFKKIDNRWRVIYGGESYGEKSVPSETSKELNQVELMKQWIGTWKCNVSKDTTAVWAETSYGTGLEGIYKFSTKGKTYMEGKEFAGYDKRIDKYIAAQMFKGKDIEIYALWFILKNKCILLPFSDISNPEAASFRTESTFVSPDTEIDTIFINNKPVKTETWTREK